MGELIVISGPPGAGKSTVSRSLAGRFDPSVLVAGDAFFGFLSTGAIEPWLAGSREQNEIVTEAAASAAGVFANGPYTVVYDGVVGPWLLPAFARTCGLSTLQYCMLLPDVESCVDRVASRTGHGFTDEAATRHMHAEFARAAVDVKHVLTPAGPTLQAIVDAVLDGLAEGRWAYEIDAEP